MGHLSDDLGSLGLSKGVLLVDQDPKQRVSIDRVFRKQAKVTQSNVNILAGQKTDYDCLMVHYWDVHMIIEEDVSWSCLYKHAAKADAKELLGIEDRENRCRFFSLSSCSSPSVTQSDRNGSWHVSACLGHLSGDIQGPREDLGLSIPL